MGKVAEESFGPHAEAEHDIARGIGGHGRLDLPPVGDRAWLEHVIVGPDLLPFAPAVGRDLDPGVREETVVPVVLVPDLKFRLGEVREIDSAYRGQVGVSP